LETESERRTSILIVIIVAVIVGLWTLIVYRDEYRDKHCQKLMIVDIGACDSGGTCGVKFEDNTFGEEQRPVIQKVVCPTKRK
jgi:hypothetical protein